MEKGIVRLVTKAWFGKWLMLVTTTTTTKSQTKNHQKTSKMQFTVIIYWIKLLFLSFHLLFNLTEPCSAVKECQTVWFCKLDLRTVVSLQSSVVEEIAAVTSCLGLHVTALWVIFWVHSSLHPRFKFAKITCPQGRGEKFDI